MGQRISTVIRNNSRGHYSDQRGPEPVAAATMSSDQASCGTSSASNDGTLALRENGCEAPSILLGGESTQMDPNNDMSAESGLMSSMGGALQLELLPHQHTLFCERKVVHRVLSGASVYRNWKISGRGEDSGMRYVPKAEIYHGQRYICAQIRGSLSSFEDIVWVRSSSSSGSDVHAIAGTEGGDVYTFAAKDVGAYISFRATLKSTSKRNNEVYQGFVGPVLAGPARLLDLAIEGVFVVDSVAVAVSKYIGGVEGRSQYWWLRVGNGGKREQISDPVEMNMDDAMYEEVKLLVTQKRSPTSMLLDLLRGASSAGTLDPRIYLLTEKDVGCELKVKCRPVRIDGVKGEVFTSKASPRIASMATGQAPSSNSHIINNNSITLYSVDSTHQEGTLLL